MKEIKNYLIALYSILFVLCGPLTAVMSESTDCMNCPTIPGEVGDYFLIWKILPATLNENSSESVAVEGKLPPFSWSVSGTGFRLADSEGSVNELLADDGACGAAEITVTDNEGNTITGYVRCSNGSWGNRTEGCIFSGGAVRVSLNSERFILRDKDKVIQKESGKYRQTQKYWGPTSLQWGQCPQEGCDDFCTTSENCHPEYGCEPCLISEQSLPCYNSGYLSSSCPPYCRRWCYCTTEYFYEEWICNPE
jgi:hypothetical protein